MGFDPSFRNWGVVIATYNTVTKETTPVKLILLETPSKEKGIPSNEADYNRIKPLINSLLLLVKEHRPEFIIAEYPIGSQSARAMYGYAVCVTMMGVINVGFGIPIYKVTPREVKVYATGNPEATKNDMIKWATDLHPTLNWPRHGKNITVTKAEHLADALASLHAGLAKHF